MRRATCSMRCANGRGRVCRRVIELGAGTGTPKQPILIRDIRTLRRILRALNGIFSTVILAAGCSQCCAVDC
jgi:hypothetical protein